MLPPPGLAVLLEKCITPGWNLERTRCKWRKDASDEKLNHCGRSAGVARLEICRMVGGDSCRCLTTGGVSWGCICVHSCPDAWPVARKCLKNDCCPAKKSFEADGTERHSRLSCTRTVGAARVGRCTDATRSGAQRGRTGGVGR